MARKRKVKKKNIQYIILFILLIISILIGTLTYKVKESSTIGDLYEPINEDFAFVKNNKAIFIPNYSDIDTMNNLTKEYKEELNKDYTLDNPYIKLNPYNTNSLSALILFKTKDEENIKVTLKGKNNNDIVLNYESSKNHIIELNYLYDNYENKIEIETNDDKKIITIKTDNNKFNKLSGVGDKNSYFLVNTSSSLLVYDNFGEVRGIFKYEILNYELLPNNHILITINDKINYLLEIDMMGYIYNKVELPEIVNNINHDNKYIYLSNKNTIYKYNLNYELLNTIKISDIMPNTTIKKIDIVDNKLYILLNEKDAILNIEDNEIKYILGSIYDFNYKYRNKVLRKVKYNDNLVKGILDFKVIDDQIYVYYKDTKKVNDTSYITDNKDYNKISCSEIKYLKPGIVTYKINENNKKYSIVNKYINNEILSFNNNELSIIEDNKVLTVNNHYDDNNCNVISNYIIELDKDNKIITKLGILNNISNVRKLTLLSNNFKFNKSKYIRISEDNKYILNRNNKTKYEGVNNRVYSMVFRENNLFFLSKNDINYITLISTRGNMYRYENTNGYIYIDNIVKGKYYIYVHEKNKIYNSNNYIEIN